MGGQSYSPDEMAVKRGIHKASELTKLQVEAARALSAELFAGNESPELLAALIQAVATNYATVQ